MKYTNKELGSYNLHMIKTDKFKTVTVRIIFRRPIEKKEVTIRNVISSILLRSSKKYDSKRKINIKSQDLYSATCSVHNLRTGNYINTIFSLNVLNDKYTEKGNLNDSLEFLSEIIFNPDTDEEKFKESKLDLIISDIKNELASIKENPNNYSLIRSLEAFDKTSSCSIRMNGYIEDLEKINTSNLYLYYQDMLNKDLIDIFVVGDFNEDEMSEMIRKNFKFRVLKKSTAEYRLKEKSARSRRLFARETIDNTQSKVNIICRCKGLSDYEMNYVLPMYSAILGGGVESKLFKEVREENSLCYSISSYANVLDNILIIQTGIDRKNFDKTLALIEKNMMDMKKGKFDEKDIKVANQFFETSLDEVEENPFSILGDYMDRVFIGIDDIETRREKIEKITKNDIMKVAKKIKMDTVFCLEGVKDEE